MNLCYWPTYKSLTPHGKADHQLTLPIATGSTYSIVIHLSLTAEKILRRIGRGLCRVTHDSEGSLHRVGSPKSLVS